MPLYFSLSLSLLSSFPWRNSFLLLHSPFLESLFIASRFRVTCVFLNFLWADMSTGSNVMIFLATLEKIIPLASLHSNSKLLFYASAHIRFLSLDMRIMFPWGTRSRHKILPLKREKSLFNGLKVSCSLKKEPTNFSSKKES